MIDTILTGLLGKQQAYILAAVILPIIVVVLFLVCEALVHRTINRRIEIQFAKHYSQRRHRSGKPIRGEARPALPISAHRTDPPDSRRRAA